MILPSAPSSSPELQKILRRQLADAGVDEDAAMRICIAANEAVINAVEHGNQRDHSKHIRADWTIEADRVELSIEDEGDGFRPENVPDPTLPENILNVCGRGLYLIRGAVDEVRHNSRGNRITMIKYL